MGRLLTRIVGGLGKAKGSGLVSVFLGWKKWLIIAPAVATAIFLYGLHKEELGYQNGASATRLAVETAYSEYLRKALSEKDAEREKAVSRALLHDRNLRRLKDEQGDDRPISPYLRGYYDFLRQSKD